MPTRSRALYLATLIFLFNASIAVTALAQNYAVDWHAIAGGGGTSSNTIYAITGTVGQPTAAHSAGGRYAIDSGFWAFAAVVQTPGTPLLVLRRSSATTLTISWPSPSTGYDLQSATDTSSANWTTLTASPADDGTIRTVVITVSQGNQFFRLLKPVPGL